MLGSSAVLRDMSYHILQGFSNIHTPRGKVYTNVGNYRTADVDTAVSGNLDTALTGINRHVELFDLPTSGVVQGLEETPLTQKRLTAEGSRGLTINIVKVRGARLEANRDISTVVQLSPLDQPFTVYAAESQENGITV